MDQSDVPQGLDKASQKHENEIVIELAPDRLLHFVGVYLVILIAFVTKIFEFAGRRMTCYPIYENKSDIKFVDHANSFCWTARASNQEKSTETSASASKCQRLMTENATTGSISPTAFLQEPNPTEIKILMEWMSYAMVLEAFLFAMPMAYWHFTVGSRLMGHLKFMQLLLQDIYESVKTIPAGIYRKKAYDEKGNSLNCWMKHKSTDQENKTKQSVEERSGQNSGAGGKNKNEAPPADPRLESNKTMPFEAKRDDSSSDRENLPNVIKEIINPKFYEKQDESDKKTASKSTQTEQTNMASEENELSKNKNEADLGSVNKSVGMPKSEPSSDESEGKQRKETSFTQKIHQKKSKNEQPKPALPTAQSPGTSSSSGRHLAKQEQTEQTSSASEENKQNKDGSKADSLSEDEKSLLLEEGSPADTKPDDSQKDKTGNVMKDRHLFSMLCYENFASLQHQPYLKSVQQLISVPSFEESMEDEDNKPEILPLKHAILRQFCHQRNFNDSCFLVNIYFRKCVFSIVLSSIFLVLLTILFVTMVLPTLSHDTFLCDIPYHDHCMSCTLTGLVDFYAAFFANWLVVSINLAIASIQLHFVRNGRIRHMSYFMEDIKPLCGVALMAAHEVKTK